MSADGTYPRWEEHWNHYIRKWEYPPNLFPSEVDNGVKAVFDALNQLRPRPKGMPTEILSLRAIVGIVLSTRQEDQ